MLALKAYHDTQRLHKMTQSLEIQKIDRDLGLKKMLGMAFEHAWYVNAHQMDDHRLVYFIGRYASLKVAGTPLFWQLLERELLRILDSDF